MIASYAVQRVREHYPRFEPGYVRALLSYATFVNRERKYLYYEVPKAACTSMKMLIHSLEKLPPIKPFAVHSNREVRRDMFIHLRGEFKLASLMDFDDRAQEEILTAPDFLRFTVVRDPYTRLQSAWKDKVQLCAPGYQYLYRKIKGELPHGDDPNSFITFPEFVAAVSGDDVATCNHHWRSQVAHLFFRAMNFNLVGRIESLHDAVGAFVKHAGFPPAQSPPAANVTRAGSLYDQALADEVYARYEPDFVELGYPRDGWRSPDDTGERKRGVVPEAKFLDEVAERNIVIDHLYTENQTLRKRAREAENERAQAEKGRAQAEKERGTEPANLEACRNSTFDDLFARYVSGVDGWLAKPEAAHLYGLAKAATAGCVVEVGSYRGRSTVALGFGVNAGAGLPVYAVEPHEPFRGVYGGEFGPKDRGHFMRTMAETGLYQHVRLVNVSSQFLADSWPLPVSLLFLDADHRYEAVKRDFECWRGKLAADAVVVLDDAAIDPSSGPGRLAREIVESGAFIRERTVGKMVSLRRAKHL